MVYSIEIRIKQNAKEFIDLLAPTFRLWLLRPL